MDDKLKNSTVLVTGGAGFIGSHLCDALLESGYCVIAIDNLSTGKSENIATIKDHTKFRFIRENIENDLVLDRLASEADIIFHLAAAVGVKMIVENPVYTIRTNINGTEAVLSSANRYGCKVIIASSSEVYGKGVRIPFREDDDCLIGPTINSRWSYATSKIVDEFLGLAYFHQYGLPVVIVRLFNTIGTRQTGKYGMVVPRFIQNAIAGNPLEVYGTGNQSRCFCDVEDVVNGLIGLMEHPDAIGQVFNIGSREEISIFKLAKLVVNLTNSHSEIVNIPYKKAYAPGFEDMLRRVPDLEKITNLVNFHNKKNLKESLLRILDYEKTFK